MTAGVDIRVNREERRVQAWSGEESVGNVGVVAIDFDWGRGVVVPMAGIGAVGTAEAFRRQGIAGRMMREAVGLSRELGYPVGGVSTGRGNVARRLYTRSGYVPLFAVDDYARPVGCPEPAPAPDGVGLRPYAPGDEDGIVELWHQSYSANDFFGARAADVDKWAAQRAELLAASPQSVWVALCDGVVIGWAEYYHHWRDQEKCAFLVEEGADAAAVARALLTRLERSLADAGLEQFVFDASQHQAWMADVLRGLGCQRKDGYVFHAAVFDLADLLNRLRPLYVARLRASRLDSWPGVLRVEMGERSAEAELAGGDAGRRVEITGSYEQIVRVLCGRTSAWEAYLCGRLRITGDLGPSADVPLNAFLGQYPWFHPRRDRW